MAKFRRRIIIENDFVLVRKKSYFFDEKYSVEINKRTVKLFSQEGVIVKSEEYNYKEVFKPRIISEYDESGNCVKIMKYENGEMEPRTVDTSKYNSDGQEYESEHIYKVGFDRHKTHYRFIYLKGEDSTEIIANAEYFDQYLSRWELKETKKPCFKECNSYDSKNRIMYHHVYEYDQGRESFSKKLSYKKQKDIEGNVIKKEYYTGYVIYYENYNLHGDYEKLRTVSPNGEVSTYTYKYQYDMYGYLLKVECFREGNIKDWERLYQNEYW